MLCEHIRKTRKANAFISFWCKDQTYLKMPSEQQSETESESIALLKSRLGGFETEEGRLNGLRYQPRVNDVAITTTPKAGTTWLQQVSSLFRNL